MAFSRWCSRAARATVLVFLFVMAGWTLYHRPYSVVFSMLRNRSALLKEARHINSVRTQTARDYFQQLQQDTNPLRDTADTETHRLVRDTDDTETHHPVRETDDTETRHPVRDTVDTETHHPVQRTSGTDIFHRPRHSSDKSDQLLRDFQSLMPTHSKTQHDQIPIKGRIPKESPLLQEGKIVQEKHILREGQGAQKGQMIEEGKQATSLKLPVNHFTDRSRTSRSSLSRPQLLERRKRSYRGEPFGLNHHYNQFDQHVFNRKRKRTSSRVSVAVGIITIRRQNSNSSEDVGYVMQTAAVLHDLIKRSPAGTIFADSIVFVCNVDRNPEHHTDAVFLKKHFDFVERYGVTSFGASELKKQRTPGSTFPYRETDDRNVHDRERYDYMFCLQAARDLDPQFVLLMEDDAVPHADMPNVIQHVLQRLSAPGSQLSTPELRLSASRRLNLRARSLLRNPPATWTDTHQSVEHSRNVSSPPALLSTNFVFIKLYYPLRWQGFAFEMTRMLDLLSVSVVLSVLLAAVVRIARRLLPVNFYRTLSRKLVFQRNLAQSLPLAAVVKISHTLLPANFYRALSSTLLFQRYQVQTLVLFSMLVCLLIGRQNLNEFRRFSRFFYRLQPSPGCCTQAMLYPNDVIPDLITWLSRCRSGTHVDLCIADFVEQYSLPAYSLEPNLVRHIGLVTTLQLRNKDPEEILF
ncbi:hypothetical protein BaRGS_00003279 [Batillaria attramentaria]|uniref:Uncharacterized protein n=1 Tax=Batillaria attramentaria TaxID=370345 RepID=A0ABD0M0T9_9CAEN